MNLGALIVLLSYLAAVQFVSRFEVRAVYGVLIAVGLPYAITLVLGWISATGYEQPVLQTIFTPASIVTVLLQAAVAFPIFHKIKETDKLSESVGLSIFGLILIAAVVPYIVGILPFIPQYWG